MKRYEPLMFPLMAALTLGLAPFVPQPHLIEKIRWLIVGKPLAPIDYFDLLMHGAPWAWLAYSAARLLRR